MTPPSLGEQHQDRAWRGAGRTGLGTSWGSGNFLLHVTDLGRAALGYGSQRNKRCQEVLLICTDPLCLLLPHTEQGAAEELHGPCLDSPSTDSYSDHSQGHIPLPAQRPSMEVTTLSPSPISPTEGDDPCEIDVTNVAIDSVTLLVCLCGLAGNGAVLWLLTLKGRNIRIFDLAVMDFLFLLLAFPSALLFLVETVSCSPIMSLLYLSFLFQLSVVSYYWGLYRLTRFSLADIKFLCQLCCRCVPPMRLLWVLDSVQYWAFFTAIIVIPSVPSLCPSHQQEHCRAALISMYTIILLLFAAPTVIASTIKFIKDKSGPQQKEPKRREIVIFLIVLFSLLLFLWSILQQLGYIVVSSHVFFLLTCIHSSIKPFIYFLAGQCWRPCSVQSLRESLQRVFEEPEKKNSQQQ